MSYIVTNMIHDATYLNVSPAQKAILIAMGRYVRPDGSGVYTSFPVLAKKTGYSYSTVRRSIKHLLAIGILIITRKYNAIDNTPYHYNIVLEALKKPPADNIVFKTLKKPPVDNSVDNSCITVQATMQEVPRPTIHSSHYIKEIYNNLSLLGSDEPQQPPQQPLFEDDVLEVKEEEPVIIPEQQPFFEDDVLAVKEDGPVIIPEGMILNPEGWVFYGKLDLVEITCVLANVANGVMEKEKVRLVQRNTAMNVLKIPHSGAWAMGYEEPLLKLVAFLDKIWITIPVAANTPRHTMRC